MLPGGDLADVVLGHRRELDKEVLVETEVGIDVLEEAAELRDLLLDLLLGAEDVRVVLDEAPDAHDAVQGAARLVTGAVAELGETQWQVLVTAGAALEDLERARAVHRLHREKTLLALGDEHVLLVVAPVSAAFPQRTRHQRGRIDLAVAVGDQLLAHVVLKRHIDRPPARMPEDLARVLGIDVEEVELDAQLAVIAALRLLGASNDLIHLRLILGDDAVDALEHLVVDVAAVIGTRHTRQLHDADLLRMLDMRAAAHLHVIADRVSRDRDAVCDDVRQALELVPLAREKRLRLVRRHFLAHERLVKGDETGDLRLNLREVLRRQPVRQVEIVVESVIRRRPDVNLHVFEDVHDRARRQVRRAMPPLLNSNLAHFTPLGKHIISQSSVTRIPLSSSYPWKDWALTPKRRTSTGLTSSRPASVFTHHHDCPFSTTRAKMTFSSPSENFVWQRVSLMPSKEILTNAEWRT